MGGWTAPDEACPNYEDLIHNMYIGNGFLKKEFDIKPRIGWMMDSFGHSQATAALFTDFGFEAFFLSRIHPDKRDELRKGKALEFIWRPFTKHFGNQKQILTHVTWENYKWPEGFIVDQKEDLHQSFQPDKSLDNYNIESKCRKLHNDITE